MSDEQPAAREPTKRALDPARFYAVSAQPSETFALERAIIADARFRNLGGTAQAVLLVFVNTYADRRGRGLVKQKTLGEQLGVDASNIRKAIRQIEATGLIRTTGKSRPSDGLRGANEMAIDPDVVTCSGEIAYTWSAQAKSPTRTRSGEIALATSSGEIARAERVLNGKMNGLCNDCGTGGGYHAADCPHARKAFA